VKPFEPSPEAPLPPTSPEPPRWTPTLAVRASVLLHAAAAGATAFDPTSWGAALAAVAGNHAAIGLVAMTPQSRLLGPVIVRLPGTASQVALTFDDGPDPAVTPHVLDLLDRYGVTASFFCIGARARAHPAIVRDIVRRGHAVENHTMTHPNAFAFYLPPAMRCEIGGADDILQAIAGRKPQFFRPPMGFRGPLLDYVLTGAGLRGVSWTRRGYDTACRNSWRVLHRLTRGLRAGDIVLLHDGNAARDDTGRPVILTVLPALLQQLAARGLSAVSLDRALAMPGAAAAARNQASAVYAST